VHLQIFNKKPTRCTVNLIFIALSRRHRSTCFGHSRAHHQEPPPTAFAASGYRMVAGLDVLQAVVNLLLNRPQLEARPARQPYGNQRLQRQLEGAPDDGTQQCTKHSLLVNRPQLEARPTRQSYGNRWLQRQLEGAPDDGHNSARNIVY
jgi:hypothetical protein